MNPELQLINLGRVNNRFVAEHNDLGVALLPVGHVNLVLEFDVLLLFLGNILMNNLIVGVCYKRRWVIGELLLRLRPQILLLRTQILNDLVYPLGKLFPLLFRYLSVPVFAFLADFGELLLLLLFFFVFKILLQIEPYVEDE